MADMTQTLRAPCIHEEKLHGYFGESSYYAGSSPVFDYPLYVVGFWNRSGSNLLAEYLRSTGKFRGFFENLNHEEVVRISSEHSISSFPDYIRRIADGETPFGFKASAHQLIMLLRFRIDRMFTGLKFVHIARDDILGQAVSMHIANQTQQWISSSTPKNTDVVFEAEQISAALTAISTSRLTFEMIAEAMHIPLHTVSYENLVSDPLSCVNSVMEGWGLSAGEWRPPAPTIEKQATDLNENFRSLYRQHVQKAILDAAVYREPPRPARRWFFGRRR